MLGPAFWRVYLSCYDVLLTLRPYRQMLDDAIAAARITPGMRMLDAGCGTGNIMWQVQERGIACRLVGVDSSPEMLARARQKCTRPDACEFHLLDLNAPLPFPPASFDGIIGCNVLYAVADASATLQRLATILKPGGRMVHTVPCYGYNMFMVVRQHWREVNGRERLLFLRRLPSLLLLFWCNLLIMLVYATSHPILRQVGRRRLREQQADALRAYLRVEGCHLTLTKTYAAQNWLLCYAKLPRTPATEATDVEDVP